MVEATYQVLGMSCDHCVRRVSAEITKLPGVSDVEVDLASGSVRVVSEEPLDDDSVRGASRRPATGSRRERKPSSGCREAQARRSRFRRSALTATRKLDPDIDNAAISGRSTRPNAGSKTPAAMGRAMAL